MNTLKNKFLEDLFKLTFLILLTLSFPLLAQENLVYLKTHTGKFATKKSVFLQPLAEGSVFHQYFSCSENALQNSEYGPYDEVIVAESALEHIIEYLSEGKLSTNSKETLRKLLFQIKDCKLEHLTQYIHQRIKQKDLEQLENKMRKSFSPCAQYEIINPEFYRYSLLYLSILADNPDMLQYIYDKYFKPGEMNAFTKFPTKLNLGELITQTKNNENIIQFAFNNHFLKTSEWFAHHADFKEHFNLALSVQMTSQGISFHRVLGRPKLAPLGSKIFKDPAGVIWSEIMKDEYEKHLHISPEAAIEYCKKLGINAELATVEDYQRLNKYFTTLFNGYKWEVLSENDLEWSCTSTPDPLQQNHYYFFSKTLGKLESYKKTDIGQFRCVIREKPEE